MADVNDVLFVLVIKRKEEDLEKKNVKSGKEKEEVLNGNEEEEEEEAAVHELPELEKLNMVDATTTPTKKRSKEAAVHELPELEKLNMVVEATTTPTKKWNVDILKIIRKNANGLKKKRVEILTFNNVEDAVENQIEYPREISFMVVEQIFSSEILPALKVPELRFIPCIIFSHSPAVVRRYIWNDGKLRSRQCTVGIIREFMEGIWSKDFATMRINATKLDDELSTTEKTSSEEEEEEPGGDAEFDDGEGQRGTRRRFF